MAIPHYIREENKDSDEISEQTWGKFSIRLKEKMWQRMGGGQFVPLKSFKAVPQHVCSPIIETTEM